MDNAIKFKKNKRHLDKQIKLCINRSQTNAQTIKNNKSNSRNLYKHASKTMSETKRHSYQTVGSQNAPVCSRTA